MERQQNYGLAPQNNEFCCFVRLTQVAIKFSVICLTEFSQDVQTHPGLLCSCKQGDLVCPQNPRDSFRFGNAKKPSKAS